MTAEICDFVNNEVERFFPTLRGRVKVTLVEGTGKILGTFDPSISEYAAKTLREQGAAVLLNSPLSSASAVSITIASPKGSSAPPLTLPHGLLVWSGGIAPLPLTLSLADSVRRLSPPSPPPRSRPRGLPINGDLSVLGLPQSLGAYALGDCAAGASPPTAQSAYQQGHYLGRRLRGGHLRRRLVHEGGTMTAGKPDEDEEEPFRDVNYGT